MKWVPGSPLAGTSEGLSLEATKWLAGITPETVRVEKEGRPAGWADGRRLVGS